jgi:hypothetical protein
MKAAISLASLIFATSIAPAEAVDLICSGAMHTYGSDHNAAAVPPGAATVDLEKYQHARWKFPYNHSFRRFYFTR